MKKNLNRSIFIILIAVFFSACSGSNTNTELNGSEAAISEPTATPINPATFEDWEKVFVQGFDLSENIVPTNVERLIDDPPWFGQYDGEAEFISLRIECNSSTPLPIEFNGLNIGFFNNSESSAQTFNFLANNFNLDNQMKEAFKNLMGNYPIIENYLTTDGTKIIYMSINSNTMKAAGKPEIETIYAAFQKCSFTGFLSFACTYDPGDIHIMTEYLESISGRLSDLTRCQ